MKQGQQRPEPGRPKPSKTGEQVVWAREVMSGKFYGSLKGLLPSQQLAAQGGTLLLSSTAFPKVL